MCASGAIKLLVKGVLPFEEARKEFKDNGAHINQILIFVAVLKLKLRLLCKHQECCLIFFLAVFVQLLI